MIELVGTKINTIEDFMKINTNNIGISTEEWDYFGQVQFGHPHGTGIMEFKNSEYRFSVYVGEFVNGRFDGYGKLTFTYGDTYEGYFKDGRMNGIGKLTWKKEGDYYEGNFINGVRSGKGKIIRSFGGYYDGDFDNNKKDGYGKFRFEDGSIFEGSFSYDRMIEGKLTTKDGKVFKGKWDKLMHYL